MTRGSKLLAFALASLLQSAASAQGVSSAAAEASFQRAVKLMEARDFRAACAAFEQSQKLDPQIGTLYNLARCHVEIGKLATAWSEFREIAQRDSNAGRKAKAGQLADQLLPRLPKLVVASTPAADKVLLDGIDITAVAASEVPIDLGAHTIVVSAKGRRDLTKTLEVRAEKDVVRLDLTFQELPAEPAAPTVQPILDQAPSDEPAEVPAHSSRRQYGLVTGVGGAVLVGGGIVFGVLARSKWNAAKDVCGDNLMCADHDAFVRGTDLTNQAKTRSTIATGLSIAGLVGVAAGVVLYVTAPSATDRDHAVSIAPAVGPEGFGVVLAGSY